MVYGLGMVPGGYRRVGIPGEYQPSMLLEEGRSQYSGAGPGRPARPGVGGTGAWTDVRGTAAGSGPVPTLRARSVSQEPSLVQDPRNAALQPIRARFDLIYLKVS